MSLQATGLVSGFDVNSIIDDLIRSESAPRSRLENREKILNAQQDKLKTINSNLLVLQSRAAGLASNTLTLQRAVTSTNEDAVEATASSGAPRQDYQLDVASLATSSRVSSDSAISSSIEMGRLVEIRLEKDSDNSGLPDQGSFTVDGLTKDSSGNDITVTLNQESTTLDNIVSTLNFIATDNTTTATNHTTLFESSYVGSSDDSGLSVTKRISKLNTALTDPTKQISASQLSFKESDTNFVSVIGLPVAKQTIHSISEIDGIVGSNRMSELGAVEVLNYDNSNRTVTVSTDEVGRFANSQILTFAGGGIGNATAKMTINSNPSASEGTFTLSSSSYDLTSARIIGADSTGGGQPFSAKSVNPGSFTINGLAFHVPKVQSSSLAVKFSSSTDLHSTTTLSSDLTSSATTMTVGSTSSFATSGTIRIEDEYIKYTGKTGDTFTGLTRGASSTTAAAYGTGGRIGITSVDYSSQTMSALDITAGTFKVKGASEKTVTISSTSDTLSTVIGSINSAGAGVTASLSPDGRVKLVGSAGTIVTVTDVTSNFASKLNFGQGIVSSTKLSELGIASGTFNLNGIPFTYSSSDTVNGVINRINQNSNVNLRARLTTDGFVEIYSPDGSSWRSASDLHSTSLGSDLTDSSSSITVVSTDEFPSTGVIRIGSEDIAYTGKTSTTFTGLTRGYNNTIATAHSSGTSVTDEPNWSIADSSGNLASLFGFGRSSETLQNVLNQVTASSVGSVFMVRDTIKGAVSKISMPVTTMSDADHMDADDTTITLASGTNFADQGVIKVDNEEILYTGISGSVLTGLTRGVNGTTAASHNHGASIKGAYITSGASIIPLDSSTIGNIASAGTISIEGEQITYTGKSGNTLTGATRGANLTTAALHYNGVDATKTLSASDSLGANGTSLVVNGTTFLRSSYDTVGKMVDAINRRSSTLNVIASLSRNGRFQLTALNNNQISATNNSIYELGTLSTSTSKDALQFISSRHGNVSFGGSSDTSNFFNLLGLDDLTVSTHTSSLGMTGSDTALTKPAATFRSGRKDLGVGSDTLATISSSIVAGTFKVDSTTITVTTSMKLMSLKDTINAIANVTAAFDNGQLVISSTNNTLTLSNDTATTTGDDPDTTTKVLSTLGLKETTVNKGNFAGLTTSPTLGTMSINGTKITVDLSTTISDIVASVKSDVSNVDADYDLTTDKFVLNTSSGSATRIRLGAGADTSNMLRVLNLSETVQTSEIVGTQAKLVSFSEPLLSAIQNGDTFYVNSQKVEILDLDTTGVSVADIVTAINKVSVASGVTAYGSDPDTSGSDADGKLYLKRTSDTSIVLQDGTLKVYSELRFSSSDIQIQDASNNVNNKISNVIRSTGRLGGITSATYLKDIRFKTTSDDDQDTAYEGLFENDVTQGSFSINSVTISYDNTDSLQDVLDRINASDADVTASYNMLTDKIDLVSNKTGSPLIRLDSGTLDSTTLTATSLEGGSSSNNRDNVIVHRHISSSNSVDYAYIIDSTSNQIGVFKTTDTGTKTSPYTELNSNAGSVTTAAMASGNEILDLAVKDSLQVEQQNFRSHSNFIIDSNYSDNYKVKDYVIASNVADAASSTLNDSDGISASDTSITIAAETSFATSGVIVIGNEKIRYTTKNGDSTVLTAAQRGWNGTTAAAHKHTAQVRQDIKIFAVDQVYGTVDPTANSDMGETTSTKADDGILRMAKADQTAADRDLSQKLTFDLTQPGSSNIAETQLDDANFTNSETTVTVDSTAGFATSGTIRIEDEYITYTGKTGTTFTGATRGAITGFSAATHDNDDIVTAAGENLNRLTFDSSSTTALSKVLFTLRGNAANDIFDGFIAGNEVLVKDNDSAKFFEGVITSKTSDDVVVIRPTPKFIKHSDNSRTTTPQNSNLSYLDEAYFAGANMKVYLGRDAVSNSTTYGSGTYIDLAKDEAGSSSTTNVLTHSTNNVDALIDVSSLNSRVLYGASSTVLADANNANGVTISGTSSAYTVDYSNFAGDVVLNNVTSNLNGVRKLKSASFSEALSVAANDVVLTFSSDADYLGTGNISLQTASSTSGATISIEGASGASYSFSGNTITSSGNTAVFTSTPRVKIIKASPLSAGTSYFTPDTLTSQTIKLTSGSNRFKSGDEVDITTTSGSYTNANAWDVNSSHQANLTSTTGAIINVTAKNLTKVHYSGYGTTSSQGLTLTSDSGLLMNLTNTGMANQVIVDDQVTVRKTDGTLGTSFASKIVAKSTNDSSGATLRLISSAYSSSGDAIFPDAIFDSSSNVYSQITQIKRSEENLLSDGTGAQARGTVGNSDYSQYRIQLEAKNAYKYSTGDFLVYRQKLTPNGGSAATSDRMLKVVNVTNSGQTVDVRISQSTLDGSFAESDSNALVGLRSLVGDATNKKGGKIIAPHQGIAFDSANKQLYVVDGTGMLRIVDTSDDTKMGSDNDLSNDKVVDLKGARFKNLFGVLRVSNDAYVYGIGQGSGWVMGEKDVGASGIDPTNLDRTLLAIKITGVNGSIPSINNAGTDIATVTPSSNSVTDGQVMTFSNSDQSRLTDSASASIKNTSELQVSAGNTIYRYNLSSNPLLSTARTAITLASETGTIRNFSIVETASSEVMGYFQIDQQGQTYLLTKASTNATLDNRPTTIETSVTAREGRISRGSDNSFIDSEYDGQGAIFTDGESAYFANSALASGTAATQYRQVKGGSLMDVAFVLDSVSQAIKVVDVSNKNNLRPLTNYRNLQTSASSAASLGTVKSISVDHVSTYSNTTYDQAFLYGVDSNGILFRVDVTDPLNPRAFDGSFAGKAIDEVEVDQIIGSGSGTMGTLTHVFVDSDTAFIAGLSGSDGKVSYLTGMSSLKPNGLDQTNLSHFAGTGSEYTLTGGAVQEIFYDDGANSVMSDSSKYLYVSNGTSTVYRFDMATPSNSVLSYDLSSHGISAAQDITVRHPSSTETHLYVTDGGSGTAIKAFDISSGTASPLTLGGVTTANDVYVHRTAGTDQAINFVTENKITTLPTTSQPNVFMSHFNMVENGGVAGSDLIGQLNGVQFTRTKNEVNDLVSGLNLKFKGTTQVGKSVSLTVDVDTDSIVTSVQDFVDQYNGTEKLLRDTVTARRIFSPRTDEDLVQGALANDVTLRGLYQRLVSLSVKPVVGDGEAKRLGDLGISRGRAGSVSISQIKQGLDLKVDEGRLRSAISSDPEGSATVFGSIAQLGTKAHRPVSQGSEAVLTLNTTDMATLRENIGKTLLIQDSSSNTIVPVTLSSISGSSAITVKGGVLDSSDYTTYPGLVEIDGLEPIVISSIIANPSENKTVLKIDDIQGLNAIVARLNNTVNIRKGGVNTAFSAGATTSEFPLVEALDTLTFTTTDDIARFQYNSATLSSAITNSSATITVSSTSDFDSSGVIRIDDEDIAYTGKTSNTFTGLTRGHGLTTRVAHKVNAVAYDGDELVFKGWSDASGTTTLDHGEAITLKIRGKNTTNKTLSVYTEKNLDKAVLVSAKRHNGILTHVETDTLTMTVTDVDTSNKLVTLEGFLDAALFNSYEYFQTVPPTGTISTTKLVKIDGQTSNISVKSIIQAASNQSKIQLLSTIVGDYSIGDNIRLNQGNKTDDLRVTDVDNQAVLNFSAVTLPTEGRNVTSDGVDAAYMGETQVTILGSDFRKFIGKSRVVLSNSSTSTDPLPINRITSGVITGVTLPTTLTSATTLSHAATVDGGVTGRLSNSETTFSLAAATTLATSGIIKIDSEYISYTSKSSNNLTGGTRGKDGSFASTAPATHTHGAAVYANKHLATFGSTLKTLSLGDDPTHANYAKFAVRYGNARTIIELDTTSSNTLGELSSRINNISGITASVTATNKLYAFNNTGTEPVTFEKLYGGTNLPDFLSLSELGSVYVSTPNKTPDLDGYSRITEVYEDTLTVAGAVTSLSTGDLLVDGVAENVQSTLSSYTRFGSGLISSRIRTIRDGLADVAQDMEVFDDRMVVKETELILEFAKLESALGSMQTQTQFLNAQLDALQSTMKTITSRRLNK